MKNKLINKFMFMFVIGLSLLFSYSSAITEGTFTVPSGYFDSSPNTLVEGGGVYANNSEFVTGYTYGQAYEVINNYYSDKSTYLANFNRFINACYSDYSEYGFDGYLILTTSSSEYRLFLFDSDKLDQSYQDYSSTIKCLYLEFLNGSNMLKADIRATSNCNFSVYLINQDTYYRSNYSSDVLPLSSHSIKSCTITFSGSNLTYTWDGENYYQKVEDEPPDFEGIADTQKATIINSIINSDDFSIVPNNYRNQFFIVYNTWTNRYKVYFYPEQYFLKGRIFEEGSTSDVSYKSYKIIAFEGSNFLWDLWQSISSFDYYVFSGYFNEDETFTSYFYDYKNSHEVNQYYFNYKDEPIVYTSRDIGFVIYNIDSNEYVDDTDNSISSTVLTDSDGNEITIEIPVDNSTVSDTPWNRFITLIKNIPENIISIFTDSSGLSRIMLIATPLVEVIRLMLGVLLSSISLLSRAVTFVYILPTIEASDALFLADVDSTTGLVFTGNSWGIKFLDGLNMVKEFSWNGLNLWTLFTSFIVAMFAIHCIKLVRKHYHY